MLACGDDDDGPTGPGDFPDLRGGWIGQYSVTGCSAVGATDPLFCDEIFYSGSSLGLELDLVQSGPDLAGDGFQGTLTGDVRGEVDMAGVVTLGGTLIGASGLVSEILAWEAVLVADSLVGSWTFEVEDQTTPELGVVTVDADFKLVGPSVETFSNCPVELDLVQNDQVDGFLGAGDCQILDPANEDESYFDLFAVDVQIGDSLAVELVSEEFSTFLLIVDVEGRPLGAHPNPPVAGADTAFLALEAVVNETWLLVANTFLNGETGNYSLVTERLNAGAASTQIVPRPVRVPRERLVSLGEILKTARVSTAATLPRAPRDLILESLRGRPPRR